MSQVVPLVEINYIYIYKCVWVGNVIVFFNKKYILFTFKNKKYSLYFKKIIPLSILF